MVQQTIFSDNAGCGYEQKKSQGWTVNINNHHQSLIVTPSNLFMYSFIYTRRTQDLPASERNKGPPHLHIVFQLRCQAEHEEVVGIGGAEVLGAQAVLCALQGPRHQLVPPGCPGAPSGASAGPGPQVRHGRVTGRNLHLYHQREDALVNGKRKLSRWSHFHVTNQSPRTGTGNLFPYDCKSSHLCQAETPPLPKGRVLRRRRTLRERQCVRRGHVVARPLPWEARCGVAIALARRGFFLTVLCWRLSHLSGWNRSFLSLSPGL